LEELVATHTRLEAASYIGSVRYAAPTPALESGSVPSGDLSFEITR
jgi:hypothetical protein